MKKTFIILCCAVLVGCKTISVQQTTFQVAGSTDVAVQAAIAGYDVFAKQGKTTVEQNQKVAAMFVKYQAAYAVYCDAGAAYAATGGTNGTVTAAFQVALANSSTSMSDILSLINSFNLK